MTSSPIFMNTNSSLSRRESLRQIALVGSTAAGLALIGKTTVEAMPTGTIPTQLTVTAVASVNSTTMRVSGALSTVSGQAIPGMAIEVYAAGSAYFSRLATLYTGNAGVFSGSFPKPPAGTKIQIEVPGNGAYNRPLPTYNRP